MEQNPAARAQSLQLLKSKLRTSSRRRSKSSRIAATLEELTPNQQEEAKLSQQFARRRHEQRLQERKLSESEAVEGTNIPDAATSTIESNSNQEDISVAELKKEFSKLVTKPPMALVHQPEELVALSRATPAPFPMKLKSYTKTVIQWSCDTCKRECIPVREESRCLCGHRYKEHPSSADNPRVKSPVGFRAFACTSSKCSCKSFFYVVAEGAWILRCRCKHRHTDHDPGTKPFVCRKPKCGCSGFDSPWVCNCDHPWSAHRQHRVEKRFDPLQLLQAQCLAPELNAVQRTDLVASPLNLRL
ncbi:FAM221A protein [Phytophthora cinnamomi]|uniref:FAM221A protein n=1 Tax=Phytophthora cinnamomi TaxID=4785 RepID=UPI0035594042|nr:FAM221A protein [Phytophthora cinnamomi]